MLRLRGGFPAPPRLPPYAISASSIYKNPGAVVAEVLDHSPPTKANWVQSPAGPLPDFRKRESCRTMQPFGEFSRGSPASPALAFRRCSILTSFQLRRLSRHCRSEPPKSLNSKDPSKPLLCNDSVSGRYKSLANLWNWATRAMTRVSTFFRCPIFVDRAQFPPVHIYRVLGNMFGNRQGLIPLNIEVLRADEGEARWIWSTAGMKGRGSGDPRENLPTSGIVQHDSHAGIRTRFALVGREFSSRCATVRCVIDGKTARQFSALRVEAMIELTGMSWSLLALPRFQASDVQNSFNQAATCDVLSLSRPLVGLAEASSSLDEQAGRATVRSETSDSTAEFLFQHMRLHAGVVFTQSFTEDSSYNSICKDRNKCLGGLRCCNKQTVQIPNARVLEISQSTRREMKRTSLTCCAVEHHLTAVIVSVDVALVDCPSSHHAGLRPRLGFWGAHQHPATTRTHPHLTYLHATHAQHAYAKTKYTEVVERLHEIGHIVPKCSTANKYDGHTHTEMALMKKEIPRGNGSKPNLSSGPYSTGEVTEQTVSSGTFPGRFGSRSPTYSYKACKPHPPASYRETINDAEITAKLNEYPAHALVAGVACNTALINTARGGAPLCSPISCSRGTEVEQPFEQPSAQSWTSTSTLSEQRFQDRDREVLEAQKWNSRSNSLLRNHGHPGYSKHLQPSAAPKEVKVVTCFLFPATAILLSAPRTNIEECRADDGVGRTRPGLPSLISRLPSTSSSPRQPSTGWSDVLVWARCSYSITWLLSGRWRAAVNCVSGR
ncbi:hypothetical protein PR048_000300 [Dryococelus australis]|uniref:Uncharacterized protein n=1 Tax=Dryococelus australis TaxID=614101 RepID=A0ABQ9IE98_9NEOP|nr:hypothetical protein PR048_000300 [Dryococelus australis]